MDEQIGDARYYLGRALEWIDAIPKDVADALPAMPGFDRDEANAALSQPAAADEAISRPCARCDTWSNCQIDDRCAETGVRVDVPCPTKATP